MNFVAGTGESMKAAQVVEPARVESKALAEEMYLILLQQTTDGVLLVDQQGQIIDVNPQACRILGYQPTELVTQALTSLEPPELAQQPALATSPPQTHLRGKQRLLRKDKVLAAVEIYTHQLSDQRRLVILHDLTEHETVEMILRENQAWLQLAHEAAELGNWRLHLQTSKIYLDERARNHYGVVGEIYSMREWLERVHPADRALVQQRGSALLVPNGVNRQRIEHRVLDDDGTVRWLLVQARVFFSEEGQAQQPLVIAGISQDITLQKQLELQLQARNQQLTLLAELSHVLAQSTQDYQALPQVAIRQIAAAFQSGCMIRLLNATGEWLPMDFFDAEPAAMEFMQLLLPALPSTLQETSLSAQIIQQGKPIFMPQLHLEQLRTAVRPEFWPLVDQVPVQSIMAAPLQVRGQAIGILYLWRLHAAAAPFTEQDLQLLQDVADRTALAIGNGQLYHGLQNELAQRLQAEQALSASERRYRTLIDTLPIAAYTTDVDGHVTLYNDAAAKLWGRRPHLGLDYWGNGWEFYGLDGQQLMPAQCPLLTATREARPLSGEEFIAIRPDQRRLSIVAYLTPLYDDQDRPIGSLNVLVDVTDRRATEDALRAEQERLAKLAATVPGIIYIFRIGVDGMLSAPYCSPGIEELLGITAAELNADISPLFTHMHPDDIAQTLATLQWDATKLAPSYLEFRFHHPQRGEIWIAAHSSPEPMKDGSVRWYGFATDITAHKHAQEQVHYQAMLLANVNDAVIATDLSFVITSWNKGAEQLYGWSAAEVVGQPFADVFRQPSSTPAALAALRQHLLQHEVWSGEATYSCKNGVQLHTLATISLVKDLAGKAIGTIGIVHDITEAKAAEAALRTSEERFNKAFRASAAALIISRQRDGCIVDVNESLLMLTALTREEIIGARLQELEVSMEGKADLDYLLQTQGVVHNWETTLRNKRGELRHLQLSIEQFESAGEQMLLTIAIDVTTHRQAEAARAQLEEQLHQAQKMETIGRLAGGVAHDFNNLLTVIQGYSDMLLAQLTPTSPFFGKLDQISRAGKRAADLTGQLLAFSRRQMLTPTDVDLNQIINNLKRMLERLIGEDILLVTALHPALWTVTVDSGRIEQAIMNLVVNARDAMPQGGVLTIKTTNVYLDTHSSPSYHSPLTGACVQLTVTDTGCGMDELVRSQIFEPFFTTKAQGKGTGLGLSTVYGIIKQSGGDITVESEPEIGSQFNLYLPAKHGTSQSGAAAELESPPMKGNETILLVEDEEMVRDLVQFTLEEAGYVVLAARAGSEAITLTTQYQGVIALLMTDVVMPQMSGRELAEYFQQFYPNTKVLFTSGYTDDAVVRHGLLTAEVAFIQKPFAPHTLLAKIRGMLDGEG